jgi:hypothetical protein
MSSLAKHALLGRKPPLLASHAVQKPASIQPESRRWGLLMFQNRTVLDSIFDWVPVVFSKVLLFVKIAPTLV